MNNVASEVVANGCIFYTDGSAVPNPGFSGYGFHGVDHVKCTHSGYGPVGATATNNAAELLAIAKCIQYVTSLPDIRHLEIRSDSRYVLDNLKYAPGWEKRQWVKSDGTNVINVPLWKELMAAEKAFVAKGGKINYVWVRGHSGIEGNERADRNANKGRLALIQGDLTHVCERIPFTDASVVEVVDTADVETKPVVKKRKGPIPALIPLINGKRWFFRTNLGHVLKDGRFFYLGSTYKDDTKLHNQNLAKRNPDTSYFILVTDKAISELDNLRERFNEAFPQMTLPVISELSNITKSSIWGKIVEHQHKFTTIKGVLAVAEDSTVLGEVLVTPKLIFKLDGIYDYGFNLLHHYENTKPAMSYHDITEHVFTEVKGKQTIHADFVQSLKTLVAKKIAVADGVTTNVKLTVGVDIPLRNTFSGLLKHTKEPIKVTLVISEVTANSYRVATIVEYENHKGAYYSPDSCYRLIGL